MWGWRSSRTVVIGSAGVIFALCCILPLAYLLAASVTGIHAAATALFLDARQWTLLYNTTLLGAGVAALSTAIGVPLGIALARVPLKRKQAMRVCLAAPMLLPPYVVALAWIYLGAGLSTAAIDPHVVSSWTYSLPAAIVVLSLVFYPLSMLASEVGLRRIDGRLEEAALVAASPRRVLQRITLPLTAPAVVAAALVIFVLAVSEFGVPGLLRVRVYTTEVFTAFAALYDFSRAIVVAIPLMVLCTAVGAIAASVFGARVVSARRLTGSHPAMFDQWGFAARLAVVAVIIVAVGMPVVVLVREASNVRFSR